MESCIFSSGNFIRNDNKDFLGYSQCLGDIMCKLNNWMNQIFNMVWLKTRIINI